MNIVAIFYKNKFLNSNISDKIIKECLNQISKQFNLNFKSVADIILNNIIDFSLVPITFYQDENKKYEILLGYNDSAYEEFDSKIPPFLRNSKILHDTVVMFNEELAKKLYFDFDHEFKIEFKGKYKNKLAYYLIDKTTQQKYNIEHNRNSLLTKQLDSLEINNKKEDVIIFNGYYRYNDNNNLTRYTKLKYNLL